MSFSRSVLATIIVLGGVMSESSLLADQVVPPSSSVSSVGQANGVTAGYVNQLTQNVLPTLVRGPQLEKFKQTFTDGAIIYRDLSASVNSDAQMDTQFARVDNWLASTYSWLKADVSDYAAERFAFRPPALSMSYNLPGTHGVGYVDKWGNYRRAISELLVNLDQLMREPSIYPQK